MIISVCPNASKRLDTEWNEYENLQSEGGFQLGRSPFLQSIVFERSHRLCSTSKVIPLPHLKNAIYEWSRLEPMKIILPSFDTHTWFTIIESIRKNEIHRSMMSIASSHFSQSAGCGQRPSFGQINPSASRIIHKILSNGKRRQNSHWILHKK